MFQEPVFPRRRHKSRVDAAEVVLVIWSCDGRDEISQVRDLSFGGLFVETPSPKAVGATATLDFLVQEGQLRADAVVRHLKPGQGVGLQFTAIMDGDGPHLAILLNRLSHSS
jgi:PilZ domain